LALYKFKTKQRKKGVGELVHHVIFFDEEICLQHWVKLWEYGL
jgi:hypothetical protein